MVIIKRSARSNYVGNCNNIQNCLPHSNSFTNSNEILNVHLWCDDPSNEIQQYFEQDRELLIHFLVNFRCFNEKLSQTLVFKIFFSTFYVQNLVKVIISKIENIHSLHYAVITVKPSISELEPNRNYLVKVILVQIVLSEWTKDHQLQTIYHHLC